MRIRHGQHEHSTVRRFTYCLLPTRLKAAVNAVLGRPIVYRASVRGTLRLSDNALVADTTITA